MEDFLCQTPVEGFTVEQTLRMLSELSGVEIPQEEYEERPR